MVSEKVSKLRGQKSEQLNPAYKWVNPSGESELLYDCGVRAICIAEEIPYTEVEQELLEKLGRVGFRYVAEIYDIYLNDTYERVVIPKPKRGESRVSIGEFARIHSDGNYVLKAAGHLSSCRNGIVYDTFDCSNKTCYTAWKIK